MSALDLWNSYLVTSDNRQFIDCRLFDDISGKEIRNKFRRMETIVGDMIAGMDIQLHDLIRKIKHRQGPTRIVIAAKTAQLMCLHGFKEIPWNAMRRYIYCFQ